MSGRDIGGIAWIERWRAWPDLLRWAVLVAPICVLTLLLVLVLRPRTEQAAAPTGYPTAVGWGSSFTPVPDTGSPPLLLDNDRLFYEPGWGTLEVRSFLEGRPGVLGGLRTWVGDQEMPLADVITGQCLFYGVNPKVVLALLELQSGLVDQPEPTPEDLDWAMGYRQESERGLEAQIHWAVIEIYRAKRDYPVVESLLLSDGQRIPLPANTNLGSYALLRVVAQTGSEAELRALQGADQQAFVQTYRRLFEEDPRQSLSGLPPASQPFLYQPYPDTHEFTCSFDHESPFLVGDGSILSAHGNDVLDLQGSICDGHNGWDYALDIGVVVQAAADGVVLWANNADDNCATRSIVLDHQNGYHTLYWHLDRLDVSPGQRVEQGGTLGLSGASGCTIGPHLHFGVHFCGREVDPEGWCGPGSDPWAEHPAGEVSTWLWADRFSACHLPAGAIVVDNAAAGFQRSGQRWEQGYAGVGNEAFWAPSEPRSGVVQDGQPSSLDGIVEAGIWRPALSSSGRYRLYAFIPYYFNNTLETQAARYLVHHAEGEDIVTIDQSLYVNRWAELGTFNFEAGREGFVYLNNLTDETGFCIWFDAILWLPQ
ncbi:MAG: peptidoglycan DD-metalloendopeptidase family protein [Chloroflexia bacterium]|nr:peptidoglycan DD-metalloendopeptidase family protein [Chloroflexia bacterium]